jgi:serine/threonine-protein phosphatase 6 regulatory subunit 3
MFWECHIVSSSIDKLLDQPSDTVKLQDFLDENDLIQECLTQNKRLIDYLIQPNVMKELIGHLITRPTDDNFRNAHVVSELLSGDFQRIQETLLEKEHLDLLYSFLLSHETDDQSPLNPILASYFSRILMTLTIRKPNELLNYFKSRETFKEDFLHHLYSTSIADVLYRLIADCGEQRSEAIQWYEDMNLIDGLFQRLLRTKSVYVQMNIVNLLSEFLRLAFDQHNGMDNDLQENMNTFLPSSTNERLYNGDRNDEGLYFIYDLNKKFIDIILKEVWAKKHRSVDKTSYIHFEGIPSSLPQL